jgi:hypothetical protein
MFEALDSIPSTETKQKNWLFQYGTTKVFTGHLPAAVKILPVL